MDERTGLPNDRLPHSGSAIFGPYEPTELSAVRLIPWAIVGVIFIWWVADILTCAIGG